MNLWHSVSRLQQCCLFPMGSSVMAVVVIARMTTDRFPVKRHIRPFVVHFIHKKYSRSLLSAVCIFSLPSSSASEQQAQWSKNEVSVVFTLSPTLPFLLMPLWSINVCVFVSLHGIIQLYTLAHICPLCLSILLIPLMSHTPNINMVYGCQWPVQ